MELEEEELCPYCNGSGEGMHDGTRCNHCGGSGVEREREEHGRSYDDIHDELPDEYFESHGSKVNPLFEDILKPYRGR